MSGGFTPNGNGLSMSQFDFARAGESVSFSGSELKSLLSLARSGIRRLVAAQRRLLADSGLLPPGR